MDEIRFVVFEARYFFLDVAARKRPFLLPEVEKKTKVKKKNKQNTNFGPIFECRLASRTLIDGRRFFSRISPFFPFSACISLRFLCAALRSIADVVFVVVVRPPPSKRLWQIKISPHIGKRQQKDKKKLCLLLIRLRFDLGPLYRGSAVTLALVSTATLDQFTPVNKKKNITKHLNTLRRCRFYLAEHVPFLMKKKLVIV